MRGSLFAASDGDEVAVLLAQVAVDLEEALQQPLGRAGVDLEVGRVRRDRRHDAIEESLIDRNLRLHELLHERLMLERRRRFVAGGIARVGADPRVDVLIVAEREEADPHRRIGEADRRSRIEGIARVADLHAGLDVFRSRAQHHEFGAAKIDEVVDRDDRDPRRIEAHHQVARPRLPTVRRPKNTFACCRSTTSWPVR